MVDFNPDPRADTCWQTEGTAVVEYDSPRWYLDPPTIIETTIAKITATQIVLANGHRYRRDWLRRVGASARDGFRLLPADHPSAAGAVVECLAASTSNEVTALLSDLGRTWQVPLLAAERAATYRAAAEMLTAAADAIEQHAASEPAAEGGK
jgi:hypothetical protein